MAELPSGTVTFLFSDIEESTRLLDELGPEAYREALREHRRVLREVFGRHGGYEVDYQGDAFFVAFQEAVAGAAAAREAQAALADGRVRVRMGLHTGTPLLEPISCCRRRSAFWQMWPQVGADPKRQRAWSPQPSGCSGMLNRLPRAARSGSA